MATLRERVATRITRRYPFTPGCDRFANGRVVNALVGHPSGGLEWTTLQGGAEICVPLHDYIGRSVFFTGNLDRKLALIIQTIVRRGDHVVDIGANLGVVALQCCQLVGAAGRVDAFEPNPKTYELLEKSIARNRFTNIRVHQFALGPADGSAMLHFPEKNFGMATLTDGVSAARCVDVSVNVRTVDGLVDQLSLQNVRLLKIDVEGFESEVFRGAAEWLSRSPPQCILFESNLPKLSDAVDPVCSTLLAYGYELFAIPRKLFGICLRRISGTASERTHDLLAVAKNATDVLAGFRILDD